MGDLIRYEVCKANAEEWARYHAIYRLGKFNEWLPMSFKGEVDRYKNIDICYWVISEGKRVGGAIIRNNIIKCVFVIPPFNNKEDLIKNIISYVESNVNEEKSIIAMDVEEELIKYYEREGFILHRRDKLMICPTNKFSVAWDDSYVIVKPEHKHEEEMAKLYHETYSRHTLECISSQSYDFQVNSVKVYFNHISNLKIPSEWSTLVYDARSKKLVGACTVGLLNKLPYILDFVVHPKYQGKGIATNMMKKTLDMFKYAYPAIRLNVTLGNTAEIFYSKLGFTSLPEKGYMTKDIDDTL